MQISCENIRLLTTMLEKNVPREIFEISILTELIFILRWIIYSRYKVRAPHNDAINYIILYNDPCMCAEAFSRNIIIIFNGATRIIINDARTTRDSRVN